MPMKPDAQDGRRVILEFAADEVITQIRLANRLGHLNEVCVEESEEASDKILNELSGLVKCLEDQTILEPPVPNPR